MNVATIHHKGHEVQAELEGDTVTIRIDGVPSGKGRWQSPSIQERPMVLSFIPEPDRSDSPERDPKLTAALRRQESDELYARLETALVGNEEF